MAISRLAEGYKNIEVLLRLCAILRPLGVVDSLTIVGGGPRRSALQRKAAALNIVDAVHFPGFLAEPEVQRVLSSSHVGLFPSRYSVAENGFEGFGLVIHELAAAGLPVLVGNVAGAIAAAAHHPWAIKLDPDNLSAWVGAVEALYSDEHGRHALGTTALEWASGIDPNQTVREFHSALLSSDLR